MSTRAPALDREAYVAWRAGTTPGEPTKARIEETGIAPIRVQDDGVTFVWVCPACGWTAAGEFADEPVSGWDAPRWTREGADDSLTLFPSLGCPGFRDGRCTGHYWLRNGELAPA